MDWQACWSDDLEQRTQSVLVDDDTAAAPFVGERKVLESIDLLMARPPSPE
jgi:hypothetical protein